MEMQFRFGVTRAWCDGPADGPIGRASWRESAAATASGAAASTPAANGPRDRPARFSLSLSMSFLSFLITELWGVGGCPSAVVLLAEAFRKLQLVQTRRLGGDAVQVRRHPGLVCRAG